MRNFKYSVLSYIIGNYEHVHEIINKDEDVEYVMVTDNPTITSSTWNVVYVDNPHPEDVFYLCYEIRFNPFKYVHTDTVIRIDGSMQIVGNLDPIIDLFNEGGYDRLLSVHPTRNTIYDERLAWCQTRGFSVPQANKVLSFLAMAEGYDVKGFKGMFQMNFEVVRNNRINALCNNMTQVFLKYLAEDGKQTERVDQDLFSFVVNKYFSDMKILPVSQYVSTSGKYFKWYAHNTDDAFEDNGQYNQPYLRNEPINTIYVGE